MEIINIGDDVYWDYCNSDGEDSYGGVLIGSNAVCGHCCEDNGYCDDDYKYKDEISEYFSKVNTFKENVLDFRKRTTGRTDGEIIIKPF